jgi:putative Holliday junction resolvase
MGKVLAIDFGKVRCGLAETDDLKIIASGLPTIPTAELFAFLNNYFKNNLVDEIVIGQPIDLKGNLSAIESEILKFIDKFKIEFPTVKVFRLDERFTSKMASFIISQSGKSKKKRKEKGLIDKISATIILQNFLEQN